MTGRLATGILASRGASNPAALAAYIAGQVRGGRVIGLATGDQRQCPNCGYRSDDADFKVTSSTTADTDDQSQPEGLRTPAPDTGYVRKGAPLTVRAGAGAPGLANQALGIDLATPRLPVQGPQDVLVRRTPEGTAEIRHRRGGALIGSIVNDGAWKALYGGKQLRPHTQQMGALSELIGSWNRDAATMAHPGAEPLQPAPQQTPLMQQYGIPAIRALATPVTSANGGPRVTRMANGNGNGNGDSDDSGGGLGPRGQSVYKKLKAKGWPDAKAMTFARMAEKNTGKIGG